jgi:hypothetical protein
MALIRKHQDDYEAMAKDSAMNVHQKTAGQLRTRCALYMKLLKA